MIETFKSKDEAQNFIESYSKGYFRFESAIVKSIGDDIKDQEHFSFFNIKEQALCSVSLLEREQNVEVRITLKRKSSLVQACEIGSLDLFHRSIIRDNSEKAVALAFKLAIYNDSANIVQIFVNGHYLSGIELYENPLETTTTKDSVNSFRVLLNQYDIPDELLAKILFNNAFSILQYILSDNKLSETVLKQDRLQTSWARRMLSTPHYFKRTTELYFNSGYS